jgi:hypothetical protein
MTSPTGITFGPNGEFFVVDEGTTTTAGQVLEFHSNGTFDKMFTAPGSLTGLLPSDAVFTADGHLLTANQGGGSLPNLDGSISLFNVNGSFNRTVVDNNTLKFSPSHLVLL